MEWTLKDIESVFNIFQSIAVMAGLICAWIAYRQWKDQKSDWQIQYSMTFSGSIMENSDMAAFIRMIERNGSVGYKNGAFETSEKERIVDFALCRLSNYVELKKSGLVKNEGFYFIDYVLRHTLENKEIQDYLKFLLKIVQGNKDAHPYKQLLD